MTDPLSAKFSALADPTRRAILARLALGEASVNELAAPFEISLPAVSKHLKVLERAGLIARGREAQWRPCRLEPKALQSVDEWLDEYRELWEDRFDRLDVYLKDLQTKGKRRGRKKNEAVRHDTLVIERAFDAPAHLVFEAWRDVEARKRWSAPTPEVIIVYEVSDFREGGVDVILCGRPDDLRYRAIVRYEQIAPNQRLIFTEDVRELEVRRSLALITIELTTVGKQTTMLFTAQIAGLDGSDMRANYTEGWTAAFDNLETEVKRSAA